MRTFRLLSILALMLALFSCSDLYMEDLNTDKSKESDMDPNALLTTALLQPYGDFGLMDTYRSYITGFTQHMAGGWNVSNYAGSVHADNDQMRLIWDEFYSVGIKNLVDGISRSADLPNVNAIMRIHRVYMLSILTDTYGDVPCKEAGLGYLKDISSPKYDKQEEIYDFFFSELAACEAQLDPTKDAVTGDVTAFAGDVTKWQKYANALRLRFAMRISDVNPTKAKAEFEAALQKPYISSAADDALVQYLDAPFTLYDGAREYDFRVNALAEVLYGQDATSPTLICATLYNKLRDTSDPRLDRICRHYINTKRSQIKPDEGNVDVTDEVRAWEAGAGGGPHPCRVGCAWYSEWVNAPANSQIPTLAALVAADPDAGYDQNNFPARMIRPFLSIEFERPDRPGVLMTSAEVEFLLAEAKDKGWNVTGTASDHYEAGVRAAMAFLNTHYLPDAQKISDAEVNAYLAANPLGTNPKEAINTQAWILHLTNPSECWANLRRSDYPVLVNRNNIPKFGGFTYDDGNLTTPVRLKYPNLEFNYNKENYKEVNWHSRVWWDTAEGRYL